MKSYRSIDHSVTSLLSLSTEFSRGHGINGGAVDHKSARLGIRIYTTRSTKHRGHVLGGGEHRDDR
jgi:hypothetical protein